LPVPHLLIFLPIETNKANCESDQKQSVLSWRKRVEVVMGKYFTEILQF